MNLTIIIPHKNIPHLLQRCLDSIPIKNEIEVIIIDDNSENVNRNTFPGINRMNTKVVFSDKSLTAGGARNIGLKYATGAFVMFADADDFFYEKFYSKISKYFRLDYDLVYFGMNSVNSDTLEPAKRAEGIIDLLIKADSNDEDSINTVRYRFLYPSCKLIRRDFIFKNKIYFDEVPASNDTMFGVKVGTLARNIKFDSTIIYCLTFRENSLVTSYKYENLKSRLLVSFELYNYLKKYGNEKYAQSSIDHLLQIRHIGIEYLIKDFLVMCKNVSFSKFLHDLFLLIKRSI